MNRIWHQFYDEGVPASIEYPELTLFQLFQLAAEENPDGDATVFFGARLSYRQLLERVERLAAALYAEGVRKGDRVALLLPNLSGYPIAHFAVHRLGAIAVPTNPLYVERELKHQLNDAGAETVIVLDKLLSRLESVCPQTAVKRIIVMGVADFLPTLLSLAHRLKNRREAIKAEPASGRLLYRSLIKSGAAPAPQVHLSPDDTAMFVYTGGTTGVSKGAVLTHRNLVCNVYQTSTWLVGLQEKKERVLCVLPFFHSYGMTTGMHLAVLLQSSMLLLPRFELADVAKVVKRHAPTVFPAVPSMYNAVSRYPHLTPAELSSIKLCVSGGAALPAEVQRRFEARTGGRLVEGYGLTETSPVALVNPIHGHRKSGTIGVPISDTDVRVVDPDTREPVAAGGVGELAIKGPQVMQGYWNRPEETALVLSDGWLHTGDIATMDEEGFVSIVDRKKDLIISAGMNVYPREVEEVLHKHPKIVEAAVVGVASKVREEVVQAYVVVQEGEQLTKAEITEFCGDKLSRFKVPRKVIFVDELPKSAMGKVLKRVLRAGDAADSSK